MIQLDDDDIYNFIEHKTGRININLNFDETCHDYKSFFDALNKNKDVTELDVNGIYGKSGKYDIKYFIKDFRLPSNIEKLGLPDLEGIKGKLKLTPNIEKLSLRRLEHIVDIDFTKNTKLKYIKILEDSDIESSEIIIPKNVIKFYNEGYIDSCFKLPSQIQILKLYCLTHIENIEFNENKKLKKIIVLNDYEIPEEIVDLSHVYTLKTVKIKTQTKQTEFSEKLKLPYGAMIKFY